MERTEQIQRLSYYHLFIIFIKAGLAFGGGLGILAVLEDELVTRRKLIAREEFLTTYSLGRIVPSGTMTALAVAFGYRFGGLFGSLVALVALVLPAFVMTVALTIAYAFLRDGPLFTLLPVTILPAALAFIVAAALRLGKDLMRPSLDLLLAVSALSGALFLDINPAILLLAGGAIGIVAFWNADAGAKP
ncbi:MAG: hypothetical protein KatS3mg057_0118 [Herpetosiphonaceae bacterium]|nr:MAG: hypothetical protein KatS3mg057_0118 [Herpetosiphonaceae bacterium]